MKRLFNQQTFVFIALITFMLIIGIVCILVFWNWLSAGSDPSESKSETIRNISIVIGGLIALVFAIWRSLVSERQADTARKELLQERYQKGAEMMGNSILSVRLGGIYALQELSKEHPEEFHIMILRLFCAFLRHPPSEKGDGTYAAIDSHYHEQNDDTAVAIDRGRWRDPSMRSRQDIHAIIDFISQRDIKSRNLEIANRFRLDLRGADLRNVSLQLGNLSHAELAYSDLSRGFLIGTNLSETYLAGANLSHSILTGGGLSSSFLEAANLSWATMVNVRMSNANLRGCDLRSVDLIGSDLSNAKFANSDLSNADLYGVILSGADFSGKDRLSRRQKLPARGLTQSQLDEAFADPKNPPELTGVVDADTGEQLIWRGKSLADREKLNSTISSAGEAMIEKMDSNKGC